MVRIHFHNGYNVVISMVSQYSNNVERAVSTVDNESACPSSEVVPPATVADALSRQGQ